MKPIHHFIDVRQWITVLNHNLIQFPIVNNQLSGSVLFPHEEHRCSNWTFQISQFHYSGIHSIIKEFLTFSTLFLVHW